MTGGEFIVLALWVMLLPWLLGAVLLWRFRRGISAQVAFLLLTLSVAIAAFFLAPSGISRLLGVHDVDVMGRPLMLSPLGLVSALLAWPFAALLKNGRRLRP